MKGKLERGRARGKGRERGKTGGKRRETGQGRRWREKGEARGGGGCKPFILI